MLEKKAQKLAAMVLTLCNREMSESHLSNATGYIIHKCNKIVGLINIISFYVNTENKLFMS